MAEPTETKTDAGAASGAGNAADTKTTDKVETKSTSALGSVTDTKAEGDKGTAAAAEGEKKPAAKTDAKPAPVELKLPDGIELDVKLVDGFKATAAELGLDSAKAQKVFDSFVGIQQAQSKAADEAFVKQDAAWAAELKADPELGGTKWEAARVDIGRAVSHFKAEPALKILDAAGLGNHPALVRFVASVGRALREDSLAGTKAGAAAPERKPFEVIAYPTMQATEKEQ